MNKFARDNTDYIRELTAELAQMARSANLDKLAYLLDLAALEADASAKKTGTGRNGQFQKFTM